MQGNNECYKTAPSGHGHGRTTEPNSTRTRRELSGLCRHPKIACRLKLCLRVVQLFLLSSRRLLIRRLCWLQFTQRRSPFSQCAHTQRGTRSSCVAARLVHPCRGCSLCRGSPFAEAPGLGVKKKSPVYNTQHFIFKRSDLERNQSGVQHLKSKVFLTFLKNRNLLLM